jgi:hypothetical protein
VWLRRLLPGEGQGTFRHIQLWARCFVVSQPCYPSTDEVDSVLL